MFQQNVEVTMVHSETEPKTYNVSVAGWYLGDLKELESKQVVFSNGVTMRTYRDMSDFFRSLKQ